MISHAPFFIHAQPTVSYLDSIFCQGLTASPPANVVNGPVFFSPGFPFTTSLNPFNGSIGLNNGAAGPQVVNWHLPGCPEFFGSDTLIINPPQTQPLAYADTLACIGQDSLVLRTFPPSLGPGDNITVTEIQAPPGGLILTPDLHILLAQSQPGTYLLTYTNPDPCIPTSTFEISIQDTLSSVFSYAADTFCLSDGNQLPSVVDSGGIFSPGLFGLIQPNFRGAVVDSFSGMIDIQATFNQTNQAGAFWVTYEHLGYECYEPEAVQIYILDLDASFNLPNTVCRSQTSPLTASNIRGKGTFYLRNATGILDSIPNLNGNNTVDLWLPANLPQIGVYQIDYVLNDTLEPCSGTFTHILTVEGVLGSPYFYLVDTLCLLDSVVDPFLLGTPNTGVFASSAGLDLDSLSGRVHLPTSQPGTYVINYVTDTVGCTDSTLVATLEVIPPDTNHLIYDRTLACLGSQDTVHLISPFNWQSQGSLLVNGLTAPASGLQFTNGSVNVPASLLGEYDVIFDPFASCALSDTFRLSLEAPLSPFFAFDKGLYCLVDSNPTPTAPNTGGTFLGGTLTQPDSDVAIDSTTGEIDLLTTFMQIAPSNTFEVTYSLGGACPSDSSLQLVISDIDAYFALPTSQCYSEGGPVEAQQVQESGNFYVQGLDSLNNINFNVPNPTGASSVDLWRIDSLPVGRYQVIYELDSLVAPCYHVYADTIEVIGETTTPFQYPTTSFCQLDTVTPVGPFIPGTGNFKSLPGLSILSGGAIDPGASQAGTFPVYYVATTNGCRDSLLVDQITIEEEVNTFVRYGSGLNIFCRKSPNNPSPDTLSPLNGFFIASGGLPINSATGEILLQNMGPQPGDSTYTITYHPHPDSCAAPFSQVITIRDFGGWLSYDKPSYCQAQGLVPPDSFVVYGNQAQGFFTTLDTINTLALLTNGAFNTSVSDTGTYTVYYIIQDPICPDAIEASQTVTIDTTLDASFYYEPFYCEFASNPLPDSITLQGGIFSSQNPGLVIDSTTGEIDLNQSPSNSYVITYDLSPLGCPVDNSVSVTIKDTLISVFRYDQDEFCDNGGGESPIPLNGGLGTFQSLTPNLYLVLKNDGEIILDSSAIGTHIIQHIAADDCAVPYSDTIQILPAEPADFEYEQEVYCDTSMRALVLQSSILDGNTQALMTGVYSSSVGLEIVDSLTGEIDLVASDAGLYIISFKPEGRVYCPAIRTATISIAKFDSSTTISFPDPAYCQQDSLIQAQIDGDPDGNFDSPDFGLIWQPQDSGIVNLANSAAGDYRIIFTLRKSCVQPDTFNLTILPYDDPGFDFPSYSVCANGQDPEPDTIHTPGGYFANASGSVLTVDSLSGHIYLDQSAIGQHQLSYTTNSQCPHTLSQAFEIRPAPPRRTWADDWGIRKDNTYIPEDTIICAGDTLHIWATPNFGDSVLLYINNVLIDPFEDDFIFSVSDLRNGDVIKLIQDDDNCQDSVVKPMEVLEYPILTVVDSTPVIISGEEGRIRFFSDLDETQIHFNSYGNGNPPTRVSPESGITPIMDQGEIGTLELNFFSPHFFTPGIALLELQPETKGCFGLPEIRRFQINPEGNPIFIPEVFTPNGDGWNDTWHIQWNHQIQPEDYSLEVFNRSSGLEATLSPLTDTWTGEGLPSGVYWWVLYDANHQPLRKGGLTLRR